jgi:hypothetical protein
VKSLLVSMLEHYYDLKCGDQFERLFGTLEIGQNPTPLHNRYYILHWDFSLVKTQGETVDIEKAIHSQICLSVQTCAERYSLNVNTDKSDAIYTFLNLVKAVKNTEHKLYLFIDEYDNFANEIMVARLEQYESLLYGEGLFKTLFKAVKAAAGQGLDRVFITGVSPVAMSDITSGYNVAENIYLEPQFNTLCGFTEDEVKALLNALAAEPTHHWSVDEALVMMRTFYNGYRFTENTTERLYNPTLSLYFLKRLQADGQYPQEMLDDNLAMDRRKLMYISQLVNGEAVLLEALDTDADISLNRLSRRFGVEDMLQGQEGYGLMASLLYYLGVLTFAGKTGFGGIRLKIPNLVVRSLYVERIMDWLSLESPDRRAAETAARIFCQQADMQPLADFIENRMLPVLSNRDYQWSNELAVKILFLSVLFNDRMYMMISETEVSRGYVDLSMIVRPDMRNYQALDIVLEFKYLSLKELGLSGTEARNRSREDWLKHPEVVKKLDEASIQANRYGAALMEQYGLPTITRYAVVAVGLERIVYKHITGAGI